MSGFVGRHIAPEMLGLLLLEFALTFGLNYALLAPGGMDAWSPAAAHRAAVIAASVGFTSFLLGLYRPQLFMRTRSLLLKTALGGAVAFPAAWGLTVLLGMNTDLIVGTDRFWPMKILIAWIGMLFAIRIGFLLAVRTGLFVRRVAVVGPPGEVAATVAAIRSGHANFFTVTASPLLGSPPGALRAAGVRTALITSARFGALPGNVRDSYALAGVALETEPEFWERHLKRVSVDHLTAAWFDNLNLHPAGRLQAAINRVGDIGLSLGLLLFTLPLMLLVALLVRLDSAGPILYRQERVGLGGRSFVLLKFRSMRSDAEARGPAWAQRSDPRVTRVGSFMRRTRVDELPQLLNVLRGEMSFIGPRPERPHFVEKLADIIPFYRERARVKPGLTGWAQVNYPYGASVEDAKAKLSYDLYYVRQRSPLLDLVILFATVRVILFQEGAR